jgi:hypothetical protein
MTASLYIGGIFFLICMYFIIMMFIHPQYYLGVLYRRFFENQLKMTLRSTCLTS